MAVFNEKYIRYDLKLVDSFVAIFLHEVFHTMFFSYSLFNTFPKNIRDQEFLDKLHPVTMKGDKIQQVFREHYGCAFAKGGGRN